MAEAVSARVFKHFTLYRSQ